MFYPNWNKDWGYAKGNAKERTLSFEKVSLPHTNAVLPSDYFSEDDYQFVSTYRKLFDLDLEKDKKYLLSFEGFGNAIQVFLNDAAAFSSPYGYTGERVDVTSFLKNGKNVLEVILDSREDSSTPPFGGLLDYVAFGGLYRKSHFEIVPSTYIDQIQIAYLGDNKALVKVNKAGDAPLSTSLIFEKGNERHEFLIDKEECVIEFPSLQLWSPSAPNLYHVSALFLGRAISFDYGFRKIQIRDNKLYINDEPITLFGLDRHQSYPYIGYAATDEMERYDARKLYELGLNFVRLSHYPMSDAFLSECDRLGLLLFEEFPGWQHLGGEAWKERAETYLQKMILRDYNHPSIVFWGVRINESQDDHDFYKATNEIAKTLDPYRLRAGVRCIQKSELLEDVYSWNDFTYTLEKPIKSPEEVLREGEKAPILITEFCGHTYPTRKMDNEGRALHQTLIHADVHNAVSKNSGYLGASGWCAFDYNTHHNFGSGNKICYHGVCDIFRLDKMAASFYKGQRERKRGLFLDCSSSWAFGERNYGGVTPLYIFTNCDYVIFEMEGQKTQVLKERDPRFSALPFPIFRIDALSGAWGLDWKDAKITGYIDSKPVITKVLLADQLPTSLAMEASNNEIGEDDAVYVSIHLLDQAGNVLSKSTDIATISIQNGTLIGPSVIALDGGEYGFYVKGKEVGVMRISARVRSFNAETEVLVYEQNDF